MNLQWLYYFDAIAELEHYTRAAEQLHVSQSNLSHAIKELESELGAELFVRKGRNIQLTKYGKIFRPYMQKSIQALEAGIKAVQECIDPDMGTIVLAGFQSVSHFATELMVRYQSESKRVKVQFQYSSDLWKTLQYKLLNGTVDLAIATRIEYPQIASTYIGSHRVMVLVPEDHRLASCEEIDLVELDGEDFIAFDRDALLREQMDAIFQGMDIRPHIVAETPNDSIIHGLVAMGRGVSIVPYPLLGVPQGTRLIPIANRIPQRRLYLHWNNDRYIPPAAEFFRDYVAGCGAVFDEYLKLHNIFFEERAVNHE